MKKSAISTALLLASVAWAASTSAQTAPVPVLVGTCVACHGTEGNSQGPATPTIAGLSKVYFVNAMLAYKYGSDTAKIEAAAKALNVDPDDIEGFERLATVMDRIAKGYTDEEIGAMADYFVNQRFRPAAQGFDAALAARGKTLHEDACDKCHEDGGRKGDGAGTLAGQWTPYHEFNYADYEAKHRAMPKKLREKMRDLTGDDFKALLHFYASQK